MLVCETEWAGRILHLSLRIRGTACEGNQGGASAWQSVPILLLKTRREGAARAPPRGRKHRERTEMSPVPSPGLSGLLTTGKALRPSDHTQNVLSAAPVRDAVTYLKFTPMWIEYCAFFICFEKITLHFSAPNKNTRLPWDELDNTEKI